MVMRYYSVAENKISADHWKNREKAVSEPPGIERAELPAHIVLNLQLDAINILRHAIAENETKCRLTNMNPTFLGQRMFRPAGLNSC